VKDRYLKISTVPCVIQSACFISAGWSGHADAQGLRNALESLWRFTDQRGLTPLISPFTLPQGGSLRRNDEAGRATSSAPWRSMVRDGWSCKRRPSPLVPRDPPKGRVSIKTVPDTNGTAGWNQRT
jgi:hypothetical protein